MVSGDGRPACADLVELVREAWRESGLDEQGKRTAKAWQAARERRARRALAPYRWLDALADYSQIADFTGLKTEVIRHYHLRARAKRERGEEGRGAWSAWPRPDLDLSRRPLWKLSTIVIARADMPGKGTGPKKRRSYTPELRQDALARVIDEGEPVLQVARDLDIPQTTLFTWVGKEQPSGS